MIAVDLNNAHIQTFHFLSLLTAKHPEEKKRQLLNKTIQTKKKLCNLQGLTRSLNRSYRVESMNIKTARIFTNLNLADVYT